MTSSRCCFIECISLPLRVCTVYTSFLPVQGCRARDVLVGARHWPSFDSRGLPSDSNRHCRSGCAWLASSQALDKRRTELKLAAQQGNGGEVAPNSKAKLKELSKRIRAARTKLEELDKAKGIVPQPGSLSLSYCLRLWVPPPRHFLLCAYLWSHSDNEPETASARQA